MSGRDIADPGAGTNTDIQREAIGHADVVLHIERGIRRSRVQLDAATRVGRRVNAAADTRDRPPRVDVEWGEGDAGFRLRIPRDAAVARALFAPVANAVVAADAELMLHAARVQVLIEVDRKALRVRAIRACPDAVHVLRRAADIEQSNRRLSHTGVRQLIVGAPIAGELHFQIALIADRTLPVGLIEDRRRTSARARGDVIVAVKPDALAREIVHTERRIDDVTRTRLPRQLAVVLLLVTVRRRRQPGDAFGGRSLKIDESLCGERLFPREVKEQSIANQRTAHLRVEFLTPGLLGSVLERVDVACVQDAGFGKRAHRALHGIGTALGDHVDQATLKVSVLGTRAERDHFEVLEPIDIRQQETAAGARRIDGHAIQLIQVRLIGRTAVDLARTRSGREGNQVVRIACGREHLPFPGAQR